jgi:3-deoxy-7-phosphoheptulonate synthase
LPEEDKAMIIIMKHHATAEEISDVVANIEALGFKAHLSSGEERTIIGVIGDERPVDPEHFEVFDGVERVVRILHPFKLASRDFHPEDSIV